MSPRFATAFPRTRMRGLSGPTLVALAVIAIVVAGMFATMVVTVRIARRHVEGGAQGERDDADARCSSSGSSSTSRPASAATC